MTFSDDDDGSRNVVANRAMNYALQHGGVVYTQVDTTPDCDVCDKNPNEDKNCAEICDNIAYDKGLHLVNRTGRWEVILELEG
jgi:hypothetical protein